jgi:hypothetical protein
MLCMHVHIYIYIYTHVCVCVCAWVALPSILLFLFCISFDPSLSSSPPA